MADTFDEVFLRLARPDLPPERGEAARRFCRRALRLGRECFLPGAAALLGDLDPDRARDLAEAAAVCVRMIGDRHAADLLADDVPTETFVQASARQAEGGFHQTMPELLEESGEVDPEDRAEAETAMISHVAELRDPTEALAELEPEVDGAGGLELAGWEVSPAARARSRSFRDLLRRSLLPEPPGPAEVTAELDLPDVALAERMGEGAGGTLFRGRVGPREAAIRVVPVPTPAMGEALLDAARAAERLGGRAGLPEILLARAIDGAVVLARSYVEGESLASVLERIGRVDADGLIEILAACAYELERIHERDLVHGAIHPRNVHLSPDGPCLVDLELGGYPAALRTDPYRRDDGDGSLLARSPADDLHALAATVHRAATGRAPGPSAPRLERARPDLDLVGPTVDLLRHPDPDRRIREAAALVALLGGGGPAGADRVARATPGMIRAPTDEEVAAAPAGEGEEEDGGDPLTDSDLPKDVLQTIDMAVPRELAEEVEAEKAPEEPAAEDEEEDAGGDAAAAEGLVGRTLGDRYEILEELGTGAMGVVYHARQTFMDREVALKVLRPDRVGDEEVMGRFRREVRAAARLIHEHVVQTFDAGELEGHWFLAMELVRGPTLKDRIRAEGALPVEEGFTIVDQVLQGMEAAHAEGIVHRDLKAENVLLAGGGDDDPGDGGPPNAKVADFGIARLQEEAGGGGEHRFRTRVGIIIGTPEYMSPEQAAGKDADARSDIYAAAVILFEALTGRLPFKASSPLGYIGKQIAEIPPPLSDRCPWPEEIPTALDDVVARALEKSPEDRFDTAAAFREALREAVEDRPWWKLW